MTHGTAERSGTDEGPRASTVTVRLPRSLQALFPGCPTELEVRGATLLDAIDDLDGRVPGIRNRLLDAGPEIRRHLNLFVDGETPARPRTDNNPLDRKEYLLHLTRRV